MSRTKIQTVAPGSPAHRAGVRPGETLAAINGHPIIDVLDYKFYSYDPDLVLTLREGDQERKVFLDKDVGQDLGLEFETYLMDRARSCANKCVFCFVDQMPKGMRDTLYFKDDDARLSFLMGNYITLTNLSTTMRMSTPSSAYRSKQQPTISPVAMRIPLLMAS